MVFKITEQGNTQILQTLTSNEALIKQAISKASGSIWVEKTYDDLNVPKIWFEDKYVIVTPSRWLAHLVVEACKGRCCVEVISNGIDVTTFRPMDPEQAREELGLPPKRKSVLFAAAKPSVMLKGIPYEALRYGQADNWMALAVGKKLDIGRWLPLGVEVRQVGYVTGVLKPWQSSTGSIIRNTRCFTGCSFIISSGSFGNTRIGSRRSTCSSDASSRRWLSAT